MLQNTYLRDMIIKDLLSWTEKLVTDGWTDGQTDRKTDERNKAFHKTKDLGRNKKTYPIIRQIEAS